METCNTCGKPAHQPFRSYSPEGKVIHGCIDAFHDGALIEFSASHAWHYRKEARKMRQDSAKRIAKLLT